MAHPGPPQPIPPSHPQHPQHAQFLQHQQQQQTAAKLVMWSHILGWGGVGCLLVLGPGVAIAVSGGVGAGLMGLGLLGAIVGAVLGQVGRGMQGRVI